MIVAFAFALATNFYAYWFSDSVVLRLYRAREVDAASTPDYYGIVRELARNANLPMPRVYIIDNPQPNAFATGRNPENAAVAATTGLLQRLSHEEVAGVMAHELAHVKNRDTLTMTVTATLAGAISMLANFAFIFGARRDGEGRGNPLASLALMILAPLAATLVQFAISRSREYEADRIGAEICRNPLWLAGALGKISCAAKQIDNMDAEQNPATAHMFIVNPLHFGGVDNLFSTHPPVEMRIQKLREMAGARQVTAETVWQ